MNLEDLRLRYRPDEVRVLFVGESPAAGGDFFYKPSSPLRRHTREAFGLGLEVGILSAGQFLDCFAAMGCYLDDLCTAPVDRMDRKVRSRFRAEGTPQLASRMALVRPRAVVGIMLAIQEHVRKALRRAGLEDVPLYFLPFPLRGHQSRYVEGLAAVLRSLKTSGILPRVPGTCRGKERHS
jgi:hypothetical protein